MKKIFILVGPSGSGKTTLGEYLKSKGIPELVSHTTRKKRKGEIDGVTYYFISKKEFDALEKIEYSEYDGNFYCLSKKEVEEKLLKFNSVFAITDIHGVQQIKKHYPNEGVAIFIETTIDERVDRMKKRGDSKENIASRVAHAIINDELENGKYCDYIIRNDKLQKAKLALNRIILEHLHLENIKVN
mgnify:CR=1 FL=1